jgi:hypothetical protein
MRTLSQDTQPPIAKSRASHLADKAPEHERGKVPDSVD